MLHSRNKTGLHLIAGAMAAGLMASPAAFAAPAHSTCMGSGSDILTAQPNNTFGSIQATGVAGSNNPVDCVPGPTAFAKSEQAFQANGTGVQSGTHWILNK